jgi:hypothetical protein
VLWRCSRRSARVPVNQGMQKPRRHKPRRRAHTHPPIRFLIFRLHPGGRPHMHHGASGVQTPDAPWPRS